MEYFLYKLRFTTALHIGKDNSGPSLDNGQMAIHADTLFAALCCEGVRKGKTEQIVKHFQEGTLVISDALPYDREELYLPKPIIYLKNIKREDAGQKKNLRKIEYIPLKRFNEYINNLSEADLDLNKLHYSFGQLSTVTRVALKGTEQPLPYHLAAWKFREGCGLYTIVGVKDNDALSLFEKLLSDLGWSGIGGKQSSGWGKYEIEKIKPPEELQKMLNDEKAAYQMLLGTALPVDEELEEVLASGWYSLIRRGGFVRSETYAPVQLKKRSIYMLGPGSCLSKRFSGDMHDLSDNGAHPVWRCANTLFVGVNI